MRVLIGLAHLGFIQIVVYGSIFMGVFYFGFFDDGQVIKDKTEQIRAQIVQTEKSIRGQKLELQNIRELEKQIESKEDAVRYFLSYIPQEITTIDLFNYLNREAKSTGVNIEDKKDGKFIEVESVYEGLRMSIKLSGSFVQMLLFLSNLTGQKQILIVDKVSIHIFGENSVTADIQVLAFRYKHRKDKEQDKEEKKKKDV